MRNDSVHGLTAEKLAQLLAMVIEDGGEIDRAAPNGEAAGLLQEWLACPLASLPDTTEVRGILAGEKPSAPRGGKGPPVRQLLLDDRTDLETIRGIKDCAKLLARQHRDEPMHAAAVTVYYAAIAAAILHHQQRITSYSYRALAEAFDRLMDKPWMPEDLWQHFASASARAREH